MSEKVEDEADRMKRGALDGDPKKNVRAIGVPVPRIYTVLDLLNDSAVRLNSVERKALRCTTGNWKLDKLTGGFRAGFTWLMGADTSWGKSTWLVSVADENLALGKRVLIVSSEDPVALYADRLMVRRTGINAMRFRDEQLDFEEQRLVQQALKTATDDPVYCDARRYYVEDLAPHLRKLIAEHKIDMVAFDYVQEFQTKKRFQDERTKFKEIASVLRHIAKDCQIAGVLFSQLTIDEKTKIPTRKNIRECRDMANAAEVIALGFTPTEDITTKRPGDGTVMIAEAGTKCLFLDKVKNGPRNRVVAMSWDEHTATFNAVGEHGPVRRFAHEQPADIDQHDDYAGQHESA